MIDGTYTVKTEPAIGSKPARATLRTKGDVLFAEFEMSLIGKRKAEGHCDGDKFWADGTFKHLLTGKVDYALHGEVAGDTLTALLESNKGTIKLFGTRV